MNAATPYTQEQIEALRLQFILRAGIVAYPQKLAAKWRAYEGVELRGEMGKDIARTEGVVPTVISNHVKQVKEALKKDIKEPSDEAIEEKRKIYFSHINEHLAETQKYKAESEISIMSTALRNWDIYVSRKIQTPPSSIDEIINRYNAQVDSPEIMRIIRTIERVIGKFDESDFNVNKAAMDEYLGLPIPAND